MILSGKVWFTKFDEVDKQAIIDSIIINEKENNTVSQMVINQYGKIPEKLYDSHRAAVDRMMTDDPTYICTSQSQLSRLPRYDTDKKEILCSYYSMMTLLMVMFPSQRKIKGSLIRIKI